MIHDECGAACGIIGRGNRSKGKKREVKLSL
jgi:hypothetical protein